MLAWFACMRNASRITCDFEAFLRLVRSRKIRAVSPSKRKVTVLLMSCNCETRAD